MLIVVILQLLEYLLMLEPARDLAQALGHKASSELGGNCEAMSITAKLLRSPSIGNRLPYWFATAHPPYPSHPTRIPPTQSPQRYPWPSKLKIGPPDGGCRGATPPVPCPPEPPFPPDPKPSGRGSLGAPAIPLATIFFLFVKIN